MKLHIALARAPPAPRWSLDQPLVALVFSGTVVEINGSQRGR